VLELHFTYQYSRNSTSFRGELYIYCCNRFKLIVVSTIPELNLYVTWVFVCLSCHRRPIDKLETAFDKLDVRTQLVYQCTCGTYFSG